MSDELVNTLENLGLFFGGATGRLTRDYGELSGDNFQMMTMHADPEKLAKDLASLADAAARIRLLQQQLSTAREDGNRPLPFDRDQLGRFVREAWVRWAQTQPNPKPSWLVPYDELSEPDKEADRQIGETVARWTLIGDAAAIRSLGGMK